MAKGLEASRKEVRELVRQRGRRKYNIWNGYAPKGGFHFNVKGTPKYLHLMWMEGDPQVKSYTLIQEEGAEKSDAGIASALPDAICVMSNGSVEWRLVHCNEGSDDLEEFKARERSLTKHAKQTGTCLKVVTDNMLNKKMMLIRNWRLGLSYMNSVMDSDLAPYENNVLLIMGELSSSTMQQVLFAYPPEREPFLIAATFALVQKGLLESDLESQPFGLKTLIKQGM